MHIEALIMGRWISRGGTALVSQYAQHAWFVSATESSWLTTYGINRALFAYCLASLSISLLMTLPCLKTGRRIGSRKRRGKKQGSRDILQTEKSSEYLGHYGLFLMRRVRFCRTRQTYIPSALTAGNTEVLTQMMKWMVCALLHVMAHV